MVVLDRDRARALLNILLLVLRRGELISHVWLNTELLLLTPDSNDTQLILLLCSHALDNRYGDQIHGAVLKLILIHYGHSQQ